MSTKKRKIPGINPTQNGEYIARVRYGPRGSEQSIQFRGKFNEARAWQAEIKRRLDADLPLYAPIDGLEWPPQKAASRAEAEIRENKTTLYQLVEDYRKHPDLYTLRAHATKTEIDYSFRVFLDWCDRNTVRYIDDTQAQGENFYAWIVSKYGEKEYAILNIMKRIKKLFKFALAKRRRDHTYCSLDFNPMEDCRPPRPTQKEIRFLTKESELPKLREHMTVEAMRPYGTEDYRRGCWELLYYMGMRPGELCHLRWPNVHEDEGYALIARSTANEAAKRGEEAFSPKVRKSLDSYNRIELHSKAIQWLKYFRELHAKGSFCMSIKAGTFAAPPLAANVAESIIEYIREIDQPVSATDLYNALVSRRVMPPYTQKSPARYFAIRLARTDMGGRLARKGLERVYGLQNHFPEGGAEIMRFSIEKEVVIPIIRNAGPYVIGGDRPIRQHNLYDWYCELTEHTMATYPELNLRDTSPKVFRASIGSHMLQFGTDITRVSKFLRHSSINVTEKHYASLLRSDIRAAVTIVP